MPANRAVILGMLSHGVALAESVTALISDRRAVEALEIAALLFESSIVLRWLGDHGDRAGAWFNRLIQYSTDDLTDLDGAEAWAGRSGHDHAERVSQAEEDASTDLPTWPPTPSWLREQADATGRRRSWWLWRLSRSLRWTVLGVQARLVGDSPSLVKYVTREADLDELVEIAALTVESLSVACGAACELLRLAIPDLLI